MHKYRCIHIIRITNTEKILNIPSSDVRILCMSVVRTENFANRCGAITLMFFLLDKSNKMDHTFNLTLFFQDLKLVLRPKTNNYFK